MAAAMEADPAPALDIEARPACCARLSFALSLRAARARVVALRFFSPRPSHARPLPLPLPPAAPRFRPRQAYAALYSGRTRAVRLMFAAERGGPALELDALRLAADHLKKGEDTLLYTQARARALAPPRHARASSRGSRQRGARACLAWLRGAPKRDKAA
jgi:hypothetical protein